MSLAAFLRRLLALARPSRALLGGLSGLTLVEALAAVPTPLLFAWLVDRLQQGISAREVAWFVGAVLALELVGGGLRVWRVRLNRALALAAANRLRDRFFDHLLRLPYSHFLSHQAGGQANSYLNDIDDVDTAVAGLVDSGARSLALLLVLGITLTIWNPLIAAGALVMLPLTIYAQRALRARVRSSSREKVGLRERLVGSVAEAVQHAALVKGFGLEPHLAGRVTAISRRYHQAEVVMETSQAALRSSASVLFIMTQYAFFVFGALLVIDGSLALGAFLGQLLLLGRLTAPLNTLLEYGNQLVRSQAALHRVDELLAMPDEEAQRTPDLAAIPGRERGIALELDDLHFRFDPALPLIEGWDLRVAPGETVAVIGPSGCGKTTLFHLLLGLHPGYRGAIRVGGAELGRLPLAVLRRAIGVVFQEQQLFADSVRGNLLLGVDRPEAVDDAALWRALEQAHARELVARLPQGLDTRLGVDGITLSGGQRQRIAIAQAILKNPPLLLLDEATSALDSVAEREVQAALRELFVGRTSLVVAHRLSTVVDADRIVVVEHGRILDQGSHGELLARCGLYQRLYRAQVAGHFDWEQLDGSEADDA